MIKILFQNEFFPTCKQYSQFNFKFIKRTIPFLTSYLENSFKQSSFSSIPLFQMTSTSNSIHIQNPNNLKDIQESLLYYLKDHTDELHFTAFKGLRYNEYAIFIRYDRWLSRSSTSFYSYLNILNFHRSLIQKFYDHPILVVLPTYYIQTIHFLKQFITNYCQSLERYIIQFIHWVIPDAHICPADKH